MKKTIEGLGLAVLIVLMTAAVFTFLAPRFDWRVDEVLSGSMEPQLQVGSVVVTRPAALGEIKVGDIITYASPRDGNLTSHRVIEVIGSTPSQFRTKGDANEDADPFTVPAENVVGKVCFHLPYLGYTAHFIKTFPGLLLTLCLPGLLIIITELRNIWQTIVIDEIERKYRIT